MGHTCGLACWTAQEDVCHCSCGGANHGVLRNALGVQPVRSRKIQGQFYELALVCRGYGEVLKARQEHPEMFDPFKYKQTTATQREVAAWPELTSFRDQSMVNRVMNPPVCIWVRSTKYQ